MHKVRVWLAFVAGGIVAALALHVETHVRAQQADNGIVIVCAAADGALRLAAPKPACPPDQKSLQFLSGVQTSGQEDAAQRQSLDRKLSDLEKQAAALERAGGDNHGSTVIEPFTVHDRHGKTAFSVTDEVSRSGVEVRMTGAGIIGGDHGGYLRAIARTGDEVMAGAPGYPSGGFGLWVKGGPGLRQLDLDREPTTGTYRLKIFGPHAQTQPVAAIGDNSLGAGLVTVADASGVAKARMYAFKHRGIVSIFRTADTDTGAVATLTEGDHASGLLRIFNSTGAPMVEAGMAAEGYGVVRAGPASFKPGYGVLGLPGSYISGKPE